MWHIVYGGERGKIVETVSTLDSTSSRPSRHEESAPRALGKAASFLSSPSRSCVVAQAGGGCGEPRGGGRKEPHGDGHGVPVAADARCSTRVVACGAPGRSTELARRSSWPPSGARGRLPDSLGPAARTSRSGTAFGTSAPSQPALYSAASSS